MEFIAAEFDDGNPGTAAERTVWERLKRCFGVDDVGVCYYRYPIVDPQNDEHDREADFVLLHRDHGLVVVECKGFEIDNVERIEGQRWELTGLRQDAAAPYSQARDQGFRIRSPMMREPSLVDERGNCELELTPLIALPNITREEWETRGFHEGPASPRVLLADDLSPGALRDALGSLPGDRGLTTEQYTDARAVLGGGQAISGDREGLPGDADAKGDLYRTVATGLKRFDEKQEEISVQIPDGPQQIRGIAGSGKTALLARKAAAMHTKHPDWKIAVTFNTRSLYQTIRSHLERFYRDFGGDDPDWDRLDVLHGWGGKSEHGMYYRVAQSAGWTPRHVGSAKDEFGQMGPDELLGACCSELVESGNIQEEYDAVLIDEAQDFLPSFYQMCYEALAPPKRLVWAYDEAQNLTSLTAPSPRNVFGVDEDGDPRVDLSGSYAGGIQKSQIMRRSYRTPREVLMTAHVFGMGLKSRRGAVQAITTQKGWEDIGYEVVDGDFRQYGEPVEIRRPREHSPHPLRDRTAAEPFLSVESFESTGAEIAAVADAIRDDVELHGLDPDQILVVPLGNVRDVRETGDRLLAALADRGIEGNRAWEGNRSVFARDGEVTISGINRAKGNEAAMVYVASAQAVEDAYWHSNRVHPRNEAFVALTRTRAWCTVTGVEGDAGVFDELGEIRRSVRAEDPTIAFPAPDPTEIEKELAADETVATTIDQFGSPAE